MSKPPEQAGDVARRDVSLNLNVNLPQAVAPTSESGYSTGMGYGLWCAGLFGACGIHRFYVGKIGTGVLWLLTLGLFGVGQLYDLCTMKSLVRKANIREGHIPHPRQLALAYAQSKPPQLPPAKPDRRPSLRQALLQAAVKNGGELTVTQGVMATDRGFEEVEAALREMLEKGYVDVDNAPGSGVIVYRFPDLAESSNAD